MAEDDFRVLELSLQGFGCSQIMAMMALDLQQKEDPLLVRAMTGLLNGMGCGKTCGALTGGCCVLGMYAGRGALDEPESDELPLMLTELVEWFESNYGERHGGIDCNAITESDLSLRLNRCPKIVISTYTKVCDILAAHGYSIDGEQSENAA